MPPEKQAASVRMDSDLLAAIDRRAKDVGLSRNEWIERCTRWAIHNLPYRADAPTRVMAAITAPLEVQGNHSEDMGLNGIEGK